MNLEAFLTSDLRNTHIDEPNLRVYVRKSNRVLDSTVVACLDIGNVTVKEKRRGQGVFSAFLGRFEEAARTSNRAVLVESIMEPRLYAFLLRRGYRDTLHSHPIAPTVAKTWG